MEIESRHKKEKELIKTVSEQKKFVQTILDSQEQLIITTDGTSLRTVNKTFLDFFAVDSIEDFMSDYDAKCICDTFNTKAPEGYLQIKMGEDNRESWIDYVISRSFGKTHKAMISIGDTDFIFSVTAAKLPGNDGLKSAVFTDITEIEQSEIRFRLLANNISQFAWMADADGTIFWYNDRWYDYTGTTLEEMHGWGWKKVHHPDHINRVVEKISIAFEKGIVWEDSFPLRSKEGEYRWFLSRAIPIRDEDGNIIRWFGTNTDITETKRLSDELQLTNKQVADSIEYASLIQSALIPDNTRIQNYFQDYFVTWHPKDVVGGDIYLFEELRDEDECLLMVIDCTGHGAPGAFVTMLVKAIERQIISKIENDRNIDVSPAWILNYFNRTMKKLLKQESEESISNAGFDGGIIYYKKKKNILKFAGAETPLFYIEDGELKIIKGNRHSVGYKKSDANYEFKEHIIDVKAGMKFYLSTDGYFDQNGGDKGYPMGKKKFTKLIVENQEETFVDQQELLLHHLGNYQGDEERNDDVTVVGFKV